MPKKRRCPTLRARRVVDVPLREVSGICLRRGRNRQRSLIAVGDRATKIATLTLPRGDRGPLVWRIVDVGKLPGSRLRKGDSQIEAVCADGAGRVLLLQESPPRAELVDLEAGKVVTSIDLVVKGHDELARDWARPKGSRGEGAVLLPRGHLLVAKEKNPPALIEFGPSGSRPRGLVRGGALKDGVPWPARKSAQRFVPLAVWFPDETLAETCADFSDLEIGPDRRLYVLSDESATIARLDDLPATGGKVELAAVWRLDDLRGKPEGLTFTAEGHPVVALDRRKRRKNLVLLGPAIATGRQGTR